MPRGLIAVVILCLASAFHIEAADFSGKGPYGVVESTVMVPRADGSRFEALLYHPSPPTPASPASWGPFPALTFGHGFLSPPLLYADTMRHLASWGYIVIATKSGLEPFPRHDEYALDMLDTLTYLETETARPGAALYGRVDTNKFGASGHSMGGGAAMLASALDSRIRATVTFAAANTRPSAVAAAATVDIPTCIIAGSDDRIAPIPRHAGPIFDAARAPSLLAVIRGGSHCGFLDVSLPDLVCDEASISPDRQLALLRNLATAFFELYLKGRLEVWPNVWGVPLTINSAWQVDVKPGSDLAPPVLARRSRVGERVEARLTLTNRGGAPTVYRIDTLASGSLIVDAPSRTSELGPGEAVTITVGATLSPSTRLGGFIQVSAYPEADPATRSTALVILRRGR